MKCFFKFITCIFCIPLCCFGFSTQDLKMTVSKVSLESPSVNDSNYTALNVEGTLTKCSPDYPEASYDSDYNGCPRDPNPEVKGIKLLFSNTTISDSALFRFCKTNALLSQNDDQKSFSLRLVTNDESAPHENITNLVNNAVSNSFIIKEDAAEFLNIICGVE